VTEKYEFRDARKLDAFLHAVFQDPNKKVRCWLTTDLLLLSRVAVDMKLPIHIHIHRFCVDIHGYMISISIDACPVLMYPLTAHKAQLVSTVC